VNSNDHTLGHANPGNDSLVIGRGLPAHIDKEHANPGNDSLVIGRGLPAHIDIESSQSILKRDFQQSLELKNRLSSVGKKNHGEAGCRGNENRIVKISTKNVSGMFARNDMQLSIPETNFKNSEKANCPEIGFGTNGGLGGVGTEGVDRIIS
jgi:hypothetical protein